MCVCMYIYTYIYIFFSVVISLLGSQELDWQRLDNVL